MFGKILVCFHTAMSVCLATWAGALYANRVDWGQLSKNEGQVTVRKAEYEAVARHGLREADVRHRAHRAVLDEHELRRPREQEWYAQQIAFLVNGATQDNPVRQVDRAADGNPILVADPAPGAELLQMGPIKDAAGQPLNGRDDKPLTLKAFEYYNKEFAKVVELETIALQERKQAAVDDETATNELKGPRGLHVKLQKEEAKLEKVKDVRKEIRPAWLNTRVELQNLEDLTRRLDARKLELTSRFRKK